MTDNTMTDPASPAAVTEERISDDQIQYRTMILRGTGNPITADLIEGLARERAAAEARLAQANEALGKATEAIIMMSGSSDFSPEGQAGKWWAKFRDETFYPEIMPLTAQPIPTPPAQSADKCEWSFDGRGSISCSCGATGRADPHYWQILAISCDNDTKCRACGKIVKLIAPKAGDV